MVMKKPAGPTVPPAFRSRFEEMVHRQTVLPPTNSKVSGPARRQRVDGRLNRQRLMEQASAEIERGGIRASLDQIARQANVGRATLYRHFPTRQDLLAGLIDQFAERLERHAEALGTRENALIDLLAFYADQVARQPVLVEYWLALEPTDGFGEQSHARVRSVIEVALRQATMRLQPGVMAEDAELLLQWLTPRASRRPMAERQRLAQRAISLLASGIWLSGLGTGRVQ